MIEKGLLIALEGGECVGKTEQSCMLKKRIMLEYPEYQVERTCEPSYMVRELVTKRDIYDITRLYLIAAGRAQTYWDVHEPVLREGGIIVTDRYLMSTLVYQNNWHVAATEAHAQATWEQDAHVNIVLDMPVKIARKRMSPQPDVLEDVPESVWAGRRARFLYWAEQWDNTEVIDALGTHEEVHARIWKIVQPLIEKRISERMVERAT